MDLTPPTPRLLVFVDFETDRLFDDGPDPVILEAAWQVVRPGRGGVLEPLGPVYEHLVAPPSPVTVADVVEGMDPFVLQMHRESGLLDEWIAGPRVDLAGLDLDIACDVARWRRDDDRVLVAGSGVAAFDRRLIARWLPVLHRSVHYRAYDVSSVRETVEAAGVPVPHTASKAHRAGPDVAASLLQAQAWHEFLCHLRFTHPDGWSPFEEV